MRCFVLSLIAACAMAQAPKPYAGPRMPDGHPDLQGAYDLATLTPLERPPGAQGVLSKEEAALCERSLPDFLRHRTSPIPRPE